MDIVEGSLVWSLVQLEVEVEAMIFEVDEELWRHEGVFKFDEDYGALLNSVCKQNKPQNDDTQVSDLSNEDVQMCTEKDTLGKSDKMEGHHVDSTIYIIPSPPLASRDEGSSEAFLHEVKALEEGKSYVFDLVGKVTKPRYLFLSPRK